MNSTEQRMHRTVTQALEHRLDDVEPVVVRLMKNGDALYAASRSMGARISALDDRLSAMTEELEALQRRADHVSEALVTSTWRVRLRWLLKGFTSGR
jgi:hypothetical protein